MNQDGLRKLAALIRERNAIDASIAAIIDRPAEKGHVGEYIASKLFDIDLEENATNPGYDGRFRGGPFSRKSVNIKWYAKAFWTSMKATCPIISSYSLVQKRPN